MNGLGFKKSSKIFLSKVQGSIVNQIVHKIQNKKASPLPLDQLYDHEWFM